MDLCYHLRSSNSTTSVLRLFGFAGQWPDPRVRDDLSRYTASAAGATRAASTGEGGVCYAPHIETVGGITVALRGRPIWRQRSDSAQPTSAILQAYQRLGRRVAETLEGSFALVIVDRPAGIVVLALDRMGIERLTYAVCDEGLVFGSSAEAVARFPGREARLRPQALFDYLLLHMVPAPDTVYEGVHKLRPGTCAVFESGRVTVERYWMPRFVEKNAKPFLKLKQDLQQSLQDAVEACQPDQRTGAFLSGGLDSSTVAGMLGKVSGAAPRTFSIGFGVDAFNELEYAHIANRHFGAVAHEYAVTPEDILSVFPKIAAAYDEPFGNSSTVPTYFCAKLAAEHGFTHLLAGDGGDELFGGNERYARQQIFEAYYRLPAALRRRLVEPLASRIDPDGRIAPLRKLRSYVDQARIPMPERLEAWNLMYRTDLDAMLEPDFRASVDTRAPLRTMREVYESAPTTSLLNRMLFYDWHYTLSDNDLRKVGAMCELAGVRVSYPMLDPRIIDLSIRVPTRVKMSGLELRSFYKRAMSDFLPVEIIRKRKHGFSLPFGEWLKSHARLGDFIYGLLSELKGRRIVRVKFLDDLINEHRSGHPGYFGYAIWDLAMLEAWLQEHLDSTASSHLSQPAGGHGSAGFSSLTYGARKSGSGR